MNLLGILENGLFALGQVLRLPVMTLLWICVGAALFMAGGAVVDFLARRRERQGFNLELWLQQGEVLGTSENRRQVLPLGLQGLLSDIEKGRSEARLGDGGLEHLVLECEEQLRATPASATTSFITA